MADPPVQRRLAAILAADVVGYSRLVEQDETGTLATLRGRWQTILEPLVARDRGRIFKRMGDGVLAEFASAVDAVRCAVDLQREMAAADAGQPEGRRIVLRIGINLGDVVVDGDDLHGDGVNLAARLEGLAEPGGICIARGVHDQVRRKLACGFEDLGPRSVKNIAEPVHVFRVLPEVPGEPAVTAAPALPLPAKPSIAVLPFANLGEDSAPSYFADGLAADLITDLSRHPGLFVIARNSTLAFRDRVMDVRAIARDLGVRYVLEGSVRRGAGRIRINVQLVDALTGGDLWAERIDRDLADIFAVQDEVTQRIVEALVGQLIAPPPRHRTSSLAAYELLLRGRALIDTAAGAPQAVREATVLLRAAIGLDPTYAEAHRWLAFCLWSGWTHCGEPEEPARSESVRIARRAAELDPGDAGCRWVRGLILGQERRWAESEADFAAALALDPNHADAYAVRVDLTAYAGATAQALADVERALRLNPHPPGWYYWALGLAQYAIGDHDAAIATLRREETYRTASRRILAAALARAGRLDEARLEASLFMAANPRFTIAEWARTQPFRDAAMLDHFVDGYRMAGLP